MRAIAPLAVALLALPTFARAQEPAPPPLEIPEVEPLAADVETIDGIVAAFYDVISGPPGEPRQWGRDATLYLEPIFFTPTSEGPDGTPRATTVDKATWATRADPFLVEEGFVEREIHRLVRRFGNIAQVWSTYEWETAGGETGRGINGIHLWHDGTRWWITHATWDAERAGNPIPPEFLPGP